MSKPPARYDVRTDYPKDPKKFRPLRIWLDGEERFDVVAYDSEEQWIEFHNGELDMVSGEWLTEKAHGEVRVAWK